MLESIFLISLFVFVVLLFLVGIKPRPNKSNQQNNFNWLIANVVGVALYYGMGYPIRVPVGELGGPGDGLYYFLLMLPILVAFLIFNISKVIVFVRKKDIRESLLSLSTFVLVLGLWIVVFLFNRKR